MTVTTATRSASQGMGMRGFGWAVASAACFVAALFASVAMLGTIESAFETDHLVDMALWSVTWGGLSLGGLIVAGRLLLSEPMRIGPLTVAVAAVGIGLSAVVHVVLQQWEIARFGIVDPDLVGPTAGLFAVLVGVAVAGFGSLVAPPSARAWPLAATLTGSAMAAVILLGNLGGLMDGLAAESFALAAWLAASGVYVAVVSGWALLRFRRP